MSDENFEIFHAPKAFSAYRSPSKKYTKESGLPCDLCRLSLSKTRRLQCKECGGTFCEKCTPRHHCDYEPVGMRE